MAGKPVKTLVVREAFIVDRVSYMTGQTVLSSEPIVKRFPHFFDDPAADGEVVESASAAPGEKRDTPTRSKRAV